MNQDDKFERDLTILLDRLTSNAPPTVENKLCMLKDWLVKLHNENLVKINHSVMELVCAKHLIEKGYEIQIEYPLNDTLNLRLIRHQRLRQHYRGNRNGFYPTLKTHCQPLTYTSARLASKIIRYSSFAGKFALGVPPHYILPFPRVLAKPPRNRTDLEIEQIKALCDAYYSKPPVTLEEIRNARIHEIYIIDVDRTQNHRN